MLAAVPFDSGGMAGFCSTYAAAVRDDVACSLGIASGAVEVTTDSCASWFGEGDDDSDDEGEVDESIEVDVRFLMSDAGAMAARLVEQIKEPGSRIWSGYITKTMRDPEGGAPTVVPCARGSDDDDDNDGDGETGSDGGDSGGDDDDGLGA